MMTRNRPPEEFNRFEFKYFLKPGVATEFTNYLSQHYKIDKFNLNKKTYNICSLYFDSPTFTFYNERVEGLPYRHKFRIRTYGNENDNYPIYLELKDKVKDKIQKQRVEITKDFAQELINQRTFDITDAKYSDETYKKAWWLLHSYHLKPVATVSYDRISFYDKTVGFKISLDKNIRANKTTSLYKNLEGVYPLGHSTVLELKFRDSIPVNVINKIKEYKLERTAISKYAASITNLYKY